MVTTLRKWTQGMPILMRNDVLVCAHVMVGSFWKIRHLDATESSALRDKKKVGRTGCELIKA